MNDFIKSYSSHGKFQGPSEKCSWTTQIDVQKRCHVSARSWYNLSSDIACTKPEAFGYIRGQPCIGQVSHQHFMSEFSPLGGAFDVCMRFM